MTFKERFINFSNKYPWLKPVIGIFLILVGLFALVTPLTPGSWLAFIGLEMLGVRVAAWDWFKQKLWKK